MTAERSAGLERFRLVFPVHEKQFADGKSEKVDFEQKNVNSGGVSASPGTTKTVLTGKPVDRLENGLKHSSTKHKDHMMTHGRPSAGGGGPTPSGGGCGAELCYGPQWQRRCET